MPEQAYTPPETKYEVHIDELMKAIRGEDFVQGNGLWRKWGGQILREELSGQNTFLFSGQQEYIMLAEAKLIGDGIINLDNISSKQAPLAFVIYKSIIPTVNLWNATTRHWEFLNSEIGNINIKNNSVVGHLIIKGNSKAGDIFIETASVAADIRIDRSSIGFIGISNYSEVRGITISHNSKSDQIFVDKSKVDLITVSMDSSAGHIIIDESNLTNHMHIADNSQVGDILINKGSSIYKIRIAKNSLCEQIQISGNSKTDNIEITDSSQSNGIAIQENSVTGDISISQNQKALPISISGASQTGNLTFINVLLSQIDIQGNYFSLSLYNTQFQVMKIIDSCIVEFNWQSGIKGELYVSKSDIILIRIASTTLLKESVLSLSDTTLQYFLLDELFIQGSMLLRKISPATKIFEWRNINAYLGAEPEAIGIKELWQDKFTLLEKQQKEYYNKVKELEKEFGNSPLFRLSNSSLGKTEITGSDLAGFRLEYYNSRLLECFIIGSSIPQKGIKIYNPFTPKEPVIGQDKYRQKLSLFNQLKKVFENQGDVIGASVYHSIAMQVQEKLLSWRLCNLKDKLRNKVHYLFEKLGLFLNRVSNNHGESWPRALVFTLLAGGLFFTASIWGLTHWGDGKTWWDNIHKLPGFMLPTHSYDYLSKEIIETTKATYPNLKVNLWHTTWDFLGRIFVGYGIFQFISAFRRHGKKGG